MFTIANQCKRFYNIVTVKLELFMPRQVAVFVYSWHDDGDLDPAIILLLTTASQDKDEPIKVLPLILEVFNLTDYGNLSLDQIEAHMLQEVLNMVVMSPIPCATTPFTGASCSQSMNCLSILCRWFFSPQQYVWLCISCEAQGHGGSVGKLLWYDVKGEPIGTKYNILDWFWFDSRTLPLYLIFPFISLMYGIDRILLRAYMLGSSIVIMLWRCWRWRCFEGRTMSKQLNSIKFKASMRSFQNQVKSQSYLALT